MLPYVTEDNAKVIAEGLVGSKQDELTAGSNITIANNVISATTVIPQAPTEDGTYTLKCTIASGVATYSWVSGT